MNHLQFYHCPSVNTPPQAFDNCLKATHTGNMTGMCVLTTHVQRYRQGLGNNQTGLKLCAMIGAPPDGRMITEAKVVEAQAAVRYGADEILLTLDMDNIEQGEWGWVKDEIVLIRRKLHTRIPLGIMVAAADSEEYELVQFCQAIRSTNVTRLVCDFSGTLETQNHHREAVRLCTEHVRGKLPIQVRAPQMDNSDFWFYRQNGVQGFITNDVHSLIEDMEADRIRETNRPRPGR